MIRLSKDEAGALNKFLFALEKQQGEGIDEYISTYKIPKANFYSAVLKMNINENDVEIDENEKRALGLFFKPIYSYYKIEIDEFLKSRKIPKAYFYNAMSKL